jgi:ABC-type nitrate/sulfonate/bicarbonate transport system substrate-binding protein
MSTSIRSPRRMTRIFGSAAAMVVIAALAACAGQSAPTSEPTSAGALAPTDPLTVAIPLTDTPFAPVFVAEALGYFDDAGVDVTITNNVGGNGLTLITSGQADLLMLGPGGVFGLVQQGKPASIVYDTYSGGSGSITVLEGSPFKSIQDLAGKRVGVFGVGGASYGYASVYSDFVVGKGGDPFEITPIAQQSALIGALLAGQLDAVVGSKSWFSSQLDSGEVRVVLDSSDPKNQEQFVGFKGFPEGTIFGLSDALAAKHEAVVRFLSAVARGGAYIHDSTPAEIAKTLTSLDVFDSQTIEQVTTSITINQPFLSVDDGVITAATWKKSLALYGRWGLTGVDTTDPIFDYDNMVDMSYLEEALARN